MAKQPGMGDRFFVGGYNISGDINSLGEVGGGPATIDVPDITQDAQDRLGTLLNGRMNVTTYFNPATARAHEVLGALPLTARHGMYLRGTGVGSPGACMVGKQINYDPTRGQDGSILINVALQNCEGFPLEWGEQLTAGERTDTAGTNGASLDGSAATTFGAQFYLQMTNVVGTSCTITIEDSADNSSWLALSGAAFSAVNAGSVSEQRLAVTGTVRRYLRAVSSGTFSSASFVVVGIRNLTAIDY